MIKTETIIAVKNVRKASEWYQQLLGCKSAHGGNTFEILTDELGNQILSLHKWGEHQHPTFTKSTANDSNGIIIYFVVDDLDSIWNNAQQLNCIIEEAPHLNTNSGKQEFSIRDLDNYYISVTEEKSIY